MFRAKDDRIQQQQLEVQELTIRNVDNQLFGQNAGQDTVIILDQEVEAIVSCLFIDDSSAENGLVVVPAADLSIVDSSDYGGSGTNDAIKILNIASDPAADGLELGAASNFAILASTSIANSNNTTIDGDLGISAGTTVTGFPPGTVSGEQEIATSRAAQAQTDLTAAIADLAARDVTENHSGDDLGTLTLTPGVYKYDTSADLTGTLTLDADGDSDGVWVFQIGTTLDTDVSSIVDLINGAQASHVYWQVGTVATLGDDCDFKGSILAGDDIVLGSGATVEGRLLSKADITLDGNDITGISGIEVNSNDCFILKYITNN